MVLKKIYVGIEKELFMYKQELSAIKEITAALVRYEILELLQLIAEQTQKLLEVETVLIPIVNNEQTAYTYYAAIGKNSEGVLGESLPLELGICGWVWKNQRSWWSGALDDMEECDQKRWKHTASHLILTPLIGKQFFLGGIAAMDKKDGTPFDQQELEIMELFSAHAALAIENAQLFAELQKSNQLLEQRVKERTADLERIRRKFSEQKGVNTSKPSTLTGKRFFSLAEYYNIVLLGFKNNFKFRSIITKNQIDPALKLYSYPSIFTQILSGLIKNCLKHAFKFKNAGEITIKNEIQGKYLLIYIIDDGCGIKNEVSKYIFEPFFTASIGGRTSGMSLRECSYLVRTKLGGNMTCQSTLGQGTQFTLCLPASMIVE